VTENGKRRPPRPSISVVPASATEEEAAAIAAALERFLVETAPAPSPSGPRLGGWQRAALREGVEARRDLGGGWLS
jgi:hypothetical protein